MLRLGSVEGQANLNQSPEGSFRGEDFDGNKASDGQPWGRLMELFPFGTTS
jgi:hypothetical protein